MDPARDKILEAARNALGHPGDAPVSPRPTTGRLAPRTPGDLESEIALLLSEIDLLGGNTLRLSTQENLAKALQDLVEQEGVTKAAVWETPEMEDLGLKRVLSALGVSVVSPHAGKEALAECDLGVTAADAALPETGTLLLRSTAQQPRLVSLLPRVHLAIVRPATLQPDLHQALAAVKDQGHFVFITGPSRTADIELTLTIGVHGPKALYVWVLD